MIHSYNKYPVPQPQIVVVDLISISSFFFIQKLQQSSFIAVKRL